jgi:hypothetical protein
VQAHHRPRPAAQKIEDEEDDEYEDESMFPTGRKDP